ncbi:hypothetical protein TKK_0009664 [Trichogramma kaykai]
MELVKLFVKDSQKNNHDEHGYTYFHGACMYSPLHIATQYMHKDIVKILTENGANPNQLDHEMSTPLHALARLCLCECSCAHFFCDYKKPVDEIIDILLEKKANIEACNKYGDSPLQLAVSRFNFDVVKLLLERGASLDSLNEERMFSQNFESIELENYPLTLNILEVMQLLQSAEYRLDFKTRLRMLKCWMRIRGNDTDHLIPFDGPERGDKCAVYAVILYHIYIHEKFGIFLKQEAIDYLHEQRKKLESIMPRHVIEFKLWPSIIDLWKQQTAQLDDIQLNSDISLYQLCQMNYSEGYSILKKIENWHLPSLPELNHSHMNLIVKRHVANILIRQHLELFATDLFMTNYCRLNLLYTVCRGVAEKMSDNDLLRLCEQTDEENPELYL